MSQIYQIIEESIPLCSIHIQNKSNYYNTGNKQFCCLDCIQVYKQQSNQQSIANTFELKQILQNPICLMKSSTSYMKALNQSFVNAFNKQIQTENNNVYAFIKIIKQMDLFIKEKSQTYKFTNNFLNKLKFEINNKIDSIIKSLKQNNQQQLKVMTQANVYLKQINRTYTNQFLQSLQDIFKDGTSEELKQLFQSYSIKNENPFRSISEKVYQIARSTQKLIDVDWNYLQNIYKTINKTQMWSKDKIFISHLINNNLSQQNDLIKYNDQARNIQLQEYMILPYSPPYLLTITNQNSLIQGQPSIQDLNQQNLYLKFTQNQIQLLRKLHKSDQYQNQFERVSFYEMNDCAIDVIYLIPNKRFLTINYQKVTVFSYYFDRIKFQFELQIIGCNGVITNNQNQQSILLANDLKYQLPQY